MKKARILLSQPFEQILVTVLSLPRAHAPSADISADNEKLRQVLRALYEAANGRQVETALGLVPIAPPVAPFLKEARFEVETQLDFLAEVMTRVITWPSDSARSASVSETIELGNGQLAGAPADAATEEQGSGLRFAASTRDRVHPTPEISYD